MIPPIPPNETERLAALRACNVLDTPAEEAFDDLVKLAAEICQAPIALITLVDAERQWFKARIGVEASQTSREISFCAHAILENRVMIVPDTRDDPRTSDHPDVVANRGLRFYAGAPLISMQGYALGTLCVADHQPRELSPQQVEALRALSRQAVSQLELRRLLADSRAVATELIAAKSSAESQRHLAEEASRAKSLFLASMSHELRTPLNSVIGYSEMMEEEAVADGRDGNASDLRKIQLASRHLLRLINDVLDFSKLEAGKEAIFLEEFEVRQVVHDAAETIRPLMHRQRNRLEVSCPEEVGSMRCDLTKVRQCLFNLLGNAAKFTDNGVVQLRVERYLNKQQPWVEFRVTDTGVGMDAQTRERLFSPFTQGQPDIARKYGGTGLGLAITRQYCHMLGGTVNVQSEPGKGSTFTIRLPAECSQTAAPAATPTITTPPALLTITGSNRTVLVIDDDDEARDLMMRHLQREGFTPVAAASGKEGLRLARELRPAAITLDVVMPEMDGWAVLSAIKDDPELAAIPVIMLSMVDDKGMGYALGAADYLVKPIGRGQLSQLLDHYKTDKADHPVLVVEDDPDTRDLLGRTLNLEGWKVMTAEDGRAALQCIAERRPALILLDLMMPRMNGFEFLTELRKVDAWKSIPVVVVTARHLNADDRERLQGGVYKVLRKVASTRDELMSAVSELMSRNIPKT